MSTLGENVVPPTSPSYKLSSVWEQIEIAPFEESFYFLRPLVKQVNRTYYHKGMVRNVPFVAMPFLVTCDHTIEYISHGSQD